MDQRDAIIRELQQTIAELKAQLREQAQLIKEQSQRILQLELELAKAKKTLPPLRSHRRAISRNLPRSRQERVVVVGDAKEARNLAARFDIVEYTTEQQLRHSVIDRRITQGTRSSVGQRYHERMWTAIATCQKQQKNFFRWIPILRSLFISE